MQVGRASMILSVAVLGPFVILFIAAMAHHSLSGVSACTDHNPFKVPGIWHGIIHRYVELPWVDNVTTYAGEVDKPVRTYLISVFSAFGLVIVIYFVVMLVAQQSGINAQLLQISVSRF